MVEPRAHVPVLLQEVLAALAPRSGGTYIDATVGAGGHAEALLRAAGPDGRLLGIDQDREALDLATARLAPFGERVKLVHAGFADLESIARRAGYQPADGILFDLGVSSLQLDRPERGFSFQTEGPLDMRMDQTLAVPTAADLVNQASASELIRIFREFGEEPRAGRVARAIVERRQQRPFTETSDLAAVVSTALGGRRGATHPATRVFQALRLAVNRELEVLPIALEAALRVLRPGGRLVTIAFHSLEDRLVKQFLAREEHGCICPPRVPVCVCGRTPRVQVLTRHPVVPGPAELRANPRARSARLRAATLIAPAASGA